MWLITQKDTPDDYVLATNETYPIKDFVNQTSLECEINIDWIGEGVNEKAVVDGKVIIEIDERYYRPAEVDILLGDYTKAKNKLGWKPKVKLKN